MKKMNYRQVVKNKIKRKGTNAAKLSRLADINTATIYNWLSGKSNLSVRLLEKLLDILNRMKERTD